MLEQLFFALSMGFIGAAYLFVGGYLFHKALQGDITFREAAIAWGPLLLSLLGILAGGGSLVSWFSGLAGLGYLAYLVGQRHHEEKQVERELIERELRKWGKAVADDDQNAGAHLYLGNALVECGDYDTAAAHYRRALELDPSNIKELVQFLVRRSDREQSAIRAQIPELDRLEREQRERDTFGRVVTGPDGRPLAPLAEEQPAERSEATGGAREPVPERVLLGYASPEEALEDQRRNARLAEMRQVLDNSPDDLVIRYAYAAALEDAGHLGRAREEYERVLALDPEHPEARQALERLSAGGTDESKPEATGSPARQRRLEHLARLKEVLRADPGDTRPRLAYAQSLEESGFAAEAVAQYRLVLAQDPTHPEARAALARLEAQGSAELHLEYTAQPVSPPAPPRERA